MRLEEATQPHEVLACLREQERRAALRVVLDTFQRWLYLPDAGPLLVTLASVTANLLPGDPVWMLLVAPSGSGKTELLQPLAGLPRVFTAGTLTEASLLSGSPNRERAKDAKGGLLRSVGVFGIILLKDFTSILAMNRELRGPLLAALREIHDGTWSRQVGTDGGRELRWAGKCALIAGCTPTIDRHHGVMSSMGERFVMYRLPAIDADEVAGRALSHAGHQRVMREELSHSVVSFFSGLDVPSFVPGLEPTEQQFLVRLSTLVSRSRSAVERDSYNREIELVPEAESPARLAQALAQLLAGLKLIGADEAEQHALILKVGLDCIPALRRRLIEILAYANEPQSSSGLAETVGYPTGTTRRALEDLAGHRVVQRVVTGRGKSDLWHLTEWSEMSYRAVTQPFPKCQKGM